MNPAFVFPGQGAQFPGMAADLYQQSTLAKQIIDESNDILGFDIAELMFRGTEEDLRQTNVTQPAIFIHSIALFFAAGGHDLHPSMMAGHSLGEFTALAAASVLTWQDALRLVAIRAQAMKEACDAVPGTMAAILGIQDADVVRVCQEIAESTKETVVAANFNSPGQVVISGSLAGVAAACEAMKAAGAKRALPLAVGGAFHSPLMQPAREKLAEAIQATTFQHSPTPVFQNATASAALSLDEIRTTLIEQLTAPVRWTQSVENMAMAGARNFKECGPGKVLQGLIKKIRPELEVDGLAL